jgi:hypothetical protein
MNRRPKMAMKFDGNDCFVVLDGVRIAKRGQPDTPHARQWVSLEPGFAVFDNADRSSITIEFSDTRLQ